MGTVWFCFPAFQNCPSHPKQKEILESQEGNCYVRLRIIVLMAISCYKCPWQHCHHWVGSPSNYQINWWTNLSWFDFWSFKNSSPLWLVWVLRMPKKQNVRMPILLSFNFVTRQCEWFRVLNYNCYIGSKEAWANLPLILWSCKKGNCCGGIFTYYPSIPLTTKWNIFFKGGC